MIKRLLLGVVVVVFLVGMAGVLAINHLDVNLYKDKIQQAVSDKTGRQLVINGEIKVSFFPWIGLQLNDVALANAEGFDNSPFAAVRASDVNLEVLPLISGTLNVSQIQLHGLELNLQVNQDGVANWEDLLTTTTVVETETSEDILQSVEAGAPLAAALSVGGIVVTDSRVSLQNDKNGSDLKIDKFNLSTDAIQLSSPFEFKSDFTLDSRSLGFSSVVGASGALEVDLASNSYLLSGLSLTTSSNGRVLPLDKLEAALGGDLSLNLKAQTFDLNSMTATIAGVPLTGELHGTGLLESFNLFGDIRSGEFDPVAVLSDVGIKLPAGFDRSLLADSHFDLAFQHSEQQLLVNRLALSLGEIEITSDLQVANLAQSAVLSGQLSSNVFNPSPWFTSFGVVAADPLVLQSARTSFSVRQSGQLLTLNDLRITLDEFDLEGHIELTDIYSRVSPLVFELHGTELDIDRYLPATDLNEQGVDTSATIADRESFALPVDTLRALSINGVLNVDRLIYTGVTLNDIVVPIKTENQKFEIAEARAALYGGSVFNSLTLDLNSQEPLLTVTSNISAVQSAPLLADYLKSDPPISGTGILNLDMLTRGVTVDQWLQQANGAISVRFTDGAINGINIGRELRRASALFADSSTQEQDVHTDFSELGVSGEMNDGVLYSEDLSLKSPLLRITGVGTMNLPAQQVDYTANVLVAATAQGQGGEEMSALDGLSIPVPIKGSITDLSVDFTGALINAIRSDLSGQLRARKDALLEAQKIKARAALKAQEQVLKEKARQQQRNAEAVIEETKEVLIDQVQQKQEVLVQELEEQKEALQENLQKKFEKGISNLLDK